jgi:ribosomal protein L25 (general stress protein Ctc)
MTVRLSASRRTLLHVERHREAVSSGQWPADVYSPLQVNISFNIECSQHVAFHTRSGMINKLQYHLF